MFSLFVLLVAGVEFVQGYCPPGDIVYPPSLIDYSAVASALSSNLSQTLDGIASNSSTFNGTSTSFSVELTSGNASFYEYHHAAQDRNTSGVQTVDGNAIYRVGSLTKLVTMYAMLANGVDLDKTVMEYIPDLKKAGASGDWETLTVRQIGNHLGGLSRDSWFQDLASFPGALSSLGLPNVTAPAYAACKPDDTSCARDTYLKTVVDFGFNFAPAAQVTYSNQGYVMLGLVLEAATGKSYADAVKSLIFDALNMTDSSFNLPELSKGVVPTKPLTENKLGVSSFWEFNLGISDSTGGLYSTTKDISKLVRSIMNGQILSQTSTRKWMKPGALTRNPYESVGQPWEIFRRTNTPDGRPIDLYTKSGSLIEYASIAGIAEDYNFGFTVITAGRSQDTIPAVTEVQNAVIKQSLPALEDALRKAASAAYSGTYTNAAANATMTVSVDNGPGLHVTSWNVGKMDLLKIYASMHGAATVPSEGRLVWSGKQDNSWFIYFDTDLSTAQGPRDSFPACITWETLDGARIDGVTIDKFVFEMGQDGKQASGITLSALNMTMTKS